MVAQVTSAPGRRPTVPSWYSESLPLSFDLAMGIQKFRLLMKEKFENKKSKEDILSFIHEYLYVDKNAATAIYRYFKQQYSYALIPNKKEIVIEHYTDEKGNKMAIFHSLYGRRVNDALSRAIAYATLKTQHRDVDIGISDNGFYFSYPKEIKIKSSFELVAKNNFKDILRMAIDKSEVLKRRFRHCATRALMILRQYKGIKKRVGRQQVSSMILMSAVKRISDDFFILKESRREVMEDLMDIKNATFVLDLVKKKDIKVKEISTTIPSPFAFNLVLQGYSDILKMEDKSAFLRRMHNMVLAKISLNKDVDVEDFDYKEHFEKISEEKDLYREKLRFILSGLKNVNKELRKDLIDVLEGKKTFTKISKQYQSIQKRY
jgi:ATP-dependent Lhr-like helicase